jgi:hypothetical protein
VQFIQTIPIHESKKKMRTEIEQDSDKNKLGAVEYRCEEVSGDGKLPCKVRAGSVG